MKKVKCAQLLQLVIIHSVIITLFNGCKGNDTIPTPPPTITSIDPTSGKYNTSLIINGANFDAAVNGNLVKINGVIAQITEASSTKLTFNVPKGAGTGKVSLETSRGIVEGPIFTYQLTTTVSTFAGSQSTTGGYLDGTGVNAKFNFAQGMVFDDQDNLFVADRYNNRIRKITPDGVVTTFAGSGVFGALNGTGVLAQLGEPTGITRDSEGNFYVTNAGGTVSKITSAGEVSTIAGIHNNPGFADGQGDVAQFYFVIGITKDSKGNLFVTDKGSSRVRKITSDLMVTTFAGDGTSVFIPYGIARDNQDNLYTTDPINFRINKITANGTVSIFAGAEGTVVYSGFADGDVSSAKFTQPYGITFDKNGDMLICDPPRIRKISSGIVSTLAGDGTAGVTNGDVSVARFNFPYSIAINSKGEIFIGERFTFVIRKIVFE